MTMKKRPGSDQPRKRRAGKRGGSGASADSRRSEPGALRLNKILAAAGLGSRREVEELIVQGRVEIDREVVTDLASKVDPKQVTIKVDGVVLKRERLVYYALNKPPGVLSTNRDPDGRMRVVDLVPDTHRVFSVGRLDRSSEGLMLLTNDGDLAQRLAHPKFGIQKMYFVVVAGIMTREELEKLHKGVYLAEGMARIDGAAIRRQRKGCTELEVILSEGKNREIRRILARAGHKVVLLRRIAIGPLRLGMLPVGASRLLMPAEVKALYAATEQVKPAQPTKKNSRRGKGKGPAAAGQRTEAHAAQSRNFAAIDDEEALFPFGAANEDAEPEEFSSEYAVGDFDLSSLSHSEEEDEFDDDGDDDFVGNFRTASSGSVLSYEEEGTPPRAPRPGNPKRQRGAKSGGKGRSAGPGQAARGRKSGSATGSGDRKRSKFAKKLAKKQAGRGGPRAGSGSTGDGRRPDVPGKPGIAGKRAAGGAPRASGRFGKRNAKKGTGGKGTGGRGGGKRK
jgi:23S rRNA pseudouridine2605 synthase